MLDVGKLKEGTPTTEATINPQFKSALEPMLNAVTQSNLPPLPQFISAVQQLAAFNWAQFSSGFESSSELVSLASLYNTNTFDFDVSQGICPIPLYEFTAGDWELFSSGQRKDDIRQRLKELNVYQWRIQLASA
jgi:hypothetical protein